MIQLVGFLWIFHVSLGRRTNLGNHVNPGSQQNTKLTECLNSGGSYVVADNFYGIINASMNFTAKLKVAIDCIIFVQKNEIRQKPLWKKWPQVKNLFLYISKDLTKKDVSIIALDGQKCLNSTESCVHGNISTKTVCEAMYKTTYNENSCKDKEYNDKYIINITSKTCVNCDNPVKKPDETIKINKTFDDGGEVDASKAVKLMSGMKDLISIMNGTSAELSVGNGIEGVLVRNSDPTELNEVSFAYMDPNDKLKIVEDPETLKTFSRSVSISKEAFEKAVSLNISIPFAAVLRFMNMSQDENNSTVLNNEVVAIEMGAEIKNLSDTISINFKNFNFAIWGWRPGERVGFLVGVWAGSWESGLRGQMVLRLAFL
ncbi:hypothetical protein ILYODFUR_021102 [Ilyodon furcidens]|uniref:Uncharacterized protein n=1 Tax=Ilyodon furcidens TaxID=33524 RepID=A0ABV0SN26_9TELE